MPFRHAFHSGKVFQKLFGSWMIGFPIHPMMNAALGSRCDETMSLRDEIVSSRPRVN
jgi:hypothetical protein